MTHRAAGALSPHEPMAHTPVVAPESRVRLARLSDVSGCGCACSLPRAGGSGDGVGAGPAGLGRQGHRAVHQRPRREGQAPGTTYHPQTEKTDLSTKWGSGLTSVLTPSSCRRWWRPRSTTRTTPHLPLSLSSPHPRRTATSAAAMGHRTCPPSPPQSAAAPQPSRAPRRCCLYIPPPRSRLTPTSPAAGRGTARSTASVTSQTPHSTTPTMTPGALPPLPHTPTSLNLLTD